MIDYYNCSPCDFYTKHDYLLSICDEYGYRWDDKLKEFVPVNELEDESEG